MMPNQAQWESLRNLVSTLAQMNFCIRYMQVVPGGQLVVIAHHCSDRTHRKVFAISAKGDW